jgi:hypothetical protein
MKRLLFTIAVAMVSLNLLAQEQEEILLPPVGSVDSLALQQ